MATMIFLYGAPASGKTTLGKCFASALGVPFVDLDAEIVRVSGKSIPDIFAAEGEMSFRNLESKTLASIVSAGPLRPAVVSLGGGTLLREANRDLVEHFGEVWCLATPPDEELARRLNLTPNSRPLGNKSHERAKHYAAFPKRIAGSYQLDDSLVIVGTGIAKPILLGNFGAIIDRALPIVADATIADIVAAGPSNTIAAPSIVAAGPLRPAVIPLTTIPSGESHKTIATITDLWSAFARANLGRKDTVIALGGGVTGDLTGFAAATWMRGIDWINVPTTLLAMVDASTGGKTGCDLPEGKNLAGAFHSPKLVVIDTDFLKTLSPSLLAAGRAEMIKHEIIGNLPHTGDVSGIPSADEIYRNLGVKVDIVRKDPHELLGFRSLLNCGHTVAHAVEKLTDYRVSHGEAVAIGCVEEARIAVERNLAPATWPNEIASRFASAGLPTNLPDGLTREKLVPVMCGDKKREGDSVVFALPCGWGDVRNVRIQMTDLR